MLWKSWDLVIISQNSPGEMWPVLLWSVSLQIFFGVLSILFNASTYSSTWETTFSLSSLERAAMSVPVTASTTLLTSSRPSTPSPS